MDDDQVMILFVQFEQDWLRTNKPSLSLNRWQDLCSFRRECRYPDGDREYYERGLAKYLENNQNQIEV